MAAGRRVSGPFLLGSRSEKEGSDQCRESASLGGGPPHMDSPAIRRTQSRSRVGEWGEGWVGERDPTAWPHGASPDSSRHSVGLVAPPPREEFPHSRADSTRARQSRLGWNTQRNDAPAPPRCPPPLLAAVLAVPPSRSPCPRPRPPHHLALQHT